jgi:hypothetical protein
MRHDVGPSIEAASLKEVHVAVDEAGDDPRVGGVDTARIGWGSARGLLSDRDDAPAHDEHVLSTLRGCAGAVDDRAARDDG